MRGGRSRRAWVRGLVASAAFAVTFTVPVAADAAQRGGLVSTSMRSQVGVVLDEIPASMRSRVAAAVEAEPAQFWVDRAHRQLRLTAYRLVFRAYFQSNSRRDALPLPPEPLWNVTLLGRPVRHRVDGHDVVGVRFAFSSMIVTDAMSPGISEPHLDHIGGRWSEHFILPVDPELLLQRTGYACMDEESFPFGSVDSEETDSFYDQTAVVEDSLSNIGQSHFTVQPAQSCVIALRDHVGRVTTAVDFARVPYSDALASKWRSGTDTGAEPDLATYIPDFVTSRTSYRYVHDADTGGCEVTEGSVGGTGWRRLLQFATSDENVGERDLTIGGVDYTLSGVPGENDLHNLFQFSPCHQHYHFKYYGQLGWSGAGAVVNAKNGFCMQSTLRVANRETSPLNNRFSSCDFQGIAPGWADQYKAGLPNQWVDTTAMTTGTGTRSFRSNPLGLLCEGTFVDQHGAPIGPKDAVVWEPTGLTAANGEPVEAPRCRLKTGWDANNAHAVTEAVVPFGQGLITTPCDRGQIGPMRNCGFGGHPATADCPAGIQTAATFSLSAGARPQVVRVTEFSHQLHAPIPARYEDSYVPLRPGVSDQPSMLANVIVTAGAPVTVTFACPAPRAGGAYEPGGTYSIYTAPVFPTDPSDAVTRS